MNKLDCIVYCSLLFVISCTGAKTSVKVNQLTMKEQAMFDSGKYYRSQAALDRGKVFVRKSLDSAVCFFEPVADLSKSYLLNEDRRYAILYLSDIYANTIYNSNDISKLYSLYEAVGRLYPKDKILQDWLSQRLSSRFKDQTFMEKHSWILDSLLFVNSSQKRLMKERYLLETIYDSDQKYRKMLFLDSGNVDDVRKKELLDSIDIIDMQNLAIVQKILSEKGWLSIKQVGGKANAAQFLVFQHIRDSATFVKYNHVINRAFRKGNLDKGNYADYVDRYNMIKYGYQLYGTQFYNDKVTGELRAFPIKDSANFKKRIIKLGLDQSP